MSGRRGLVLAVLLCLLGSALALLATARPWITATTRSSTPTPQRTDAFLETTTDYAAADVAPAVAPLGLLALAGVAALAGTRGGGRQAVGMLLLGSGAGIVASSLRVLSAPSRLVPSGTEQVGTGAGAVIAVVGGACLTVAGVLAARYGRRWSSLGTTYDAPSSSPAVDEADLWDQLERDDGPA